MTDAERHIADFVQSAFQGVILGNGVGLLQGQGLDDYADLETLATYRSKDEKNDWSRIAVSNLNSCHSSLSFFDEEGMRFHLPAYLIADLEGTLTQDIIFHLCCFDYGAMTRFDKLNNTQRRVVREFLLLRFQDRNDEIQGPMIKRALAEYWAET